MLHLRELPVMEELDNFLGVVPTAMMNQAPTRRTVSFTSRLSRTDCIWMNSLFAHMVWLQFDVKAGWA